MGLTGLFSFSASSCGGGGGFVVAAACYVLLFLHLPEKHLPLVIKVFDSICLLLLVLRLLLAPGPSSMVYIYSDSSVCFSTPSYCTIEPYM